MAGIVQDQNYHNEQVAPALGDGAVVYLGPVGGAARGKTLGSARALLHLINFDEPFGLSVVEALACGTPVIACNRVGSGEVVPDAEPGSGRRAGVSPQANILRCTPGCAAGSSGPENAGRGGAHSGQQRNGCAAKKCVLHVLTPPPRGGV